MLTNIDKQRIRQHGQAKQRITTDRSVVRNNVIDYAKRLGAIDQEVRELLHELNLEDLEQS